MFCGILGNVVAFRDNGILNRNPALHEDHGRHKSNHDIFVGKDELRVRMDTETPTDRVDILGSIVFRTRSPSTNDLSRSCKMVVIDIPAQDYESSPDAIHHRDKLFELEVGWTGSLAEPNITDADIQGVIVANSPR